MSGEGATGATGTPGGAAAGAEPVAAVLEVRVEAALADVLVVSCRTRGRHFQGALLDCSKRNLPFGVSDLHPAFDKSDERLYSVSRRFAYQNDEEARNGNINENGNGQKRRQGQRQRKMTVRLRPRKVLCSECKGVCTENSESVARKRTEPAKIANGRPTPPPPRKRRRSDADAPDIPSASPFREDSSDGAHQNPRTLKISFGGGEGTVVKLPAIGGPVPREDGRPRSPSDEGPDGRAARRALKKAKKRARHRRKAKRKKRRKEERGGRERSESDAADDSSAEDVPARREDPSGGDSADGRPPFEIGDVVWGKLQGFPWWPGRVSAIRDHRDARVAWFASGTTSLVPRRRLAPFLDDFDIRFNKKKRGPYKEAVRLAILEAGGPAVDPSATPPNRTLAPLSSPPIDVQS